MQNPLPPLDNPPHDNPLFGNADSNPQVAIPPQQLPTNQSMAQHERTLKEYAPPNLDLV